MTALRWDRASLLVLAVATLLLAAWAGIVRMGWGWSVLFPALPMSHGPLMVGGFLGTLIGLERAVGVQKRWAYAGPLLTGVGGLLPIAGAPTGWGSLLMLLGSGVLVAVFAGIVYTVPALYTAAIGLGALLWLVGNGLWLAGWSIPQVVLWWAGFLVLTIAGERLELSRLLRLSRTASLLFVAATALFVAGVLVSLADYAAGVWLTGLGMAALAGWLARYDIAWRRLKAGGQARFVAVCLLSGYVWLAVSGLLALVYGGMTAGPFYDAILHSLFLGFVFAMIFGHAPIVFPAVLGLPIRYSPWLYSHLILLHLTLLLRVSGDLLLWMPGRQWGGLLNGVVVVIFLLNTLTSLRRET
ncbi:MAG: hypothetical protein HY328_04075 [Chloroflexi bacterium]|nr:hypothetical protein [Chloroflexota bacterium]